MSFDQRKVEINKQMILMPINTGVSEKDILEQAEEIKKLQPEMMEWRIDYFKDVVLMNRLLEVAGKVKNVMGTIPILITFRSQKFGGKTELDSEDAYLNLVKIVIDFKEMFQMLREEVDALARGAEEGEGEEKRLKEFLGHTPLEVLCGALLGILIAALIPAF